MIAPVAEIPFDFIDFPSLIDTLYASPIMYAFAGGIPFAVESRDLNCPSNRYAHR